MLRYTLIFLLVNIYGRSLGVPVKNENSNGKLLIGNLLRDLGKHCKNEFVLSQIENRNTECDVELSFRDVNLQCLMFFDANRLLCNSTVVNTAEIATEFTEKQDVSVFCSEVAHFTVPPTAYQQTITTVFRNDAACKKVCTDDDIMTGDTNFFCKYYKWTLLKLVTAKSTTHVLTPTVKAVGSGTAGTVEDKNNVTATQVSQASNVEHNVTADTLLSDIKTQSVKGEESAQLPSEVAKQESSSVAQLTSIHNQEISNQPSGPGNTIQKIAEESVPTLVGGGKTVDIVKQPSADTGAIDGGNNEAGIEMNAGGNKDPDVGIQQIETPGQKIGVENDDPDDASMDMEGDDGKEGNMDTADDGDDQLDGDMPINIDQKAKSSDKQLETQASLGGESSQRDFFQSPDGFAEDDDHFFPFFLTAVIVVVVLYVLYHNKNKVGKMFFGLIVEGRQPGRRRNSRGHAYRRLDTLEQAMSTTATAPPSKIIY